MCSLLTLSACEYHFQLGDPIPDEGNFICGNATIDHSGPGKALFQANCAACHNPMKDATGPALKNMERIRSMEWIYKFLTDRKFKSRDKRTKDLIKTFYNTRCEKFPQLKYEDVKAIFNYTSAYGGAIY